MQITDTELSQITSSAGLTIGSSDTGNIQVKGVQEASSDAVGTVTLIATKATKTISFVSAASSFSKGITVQAQGGVDIETTLITNHNAPTPTDTVIYAGVGTLTVDGSQTLSTTNGVLTITTDDTAFGASSDVSSGSAASYLFSTSAGRTIGLGSGTGDLSLNPSANEVAAFKVTGLTIGSGNSGTITVNGVADGHSDGIGSLLTLVATRDDARIVFETGSSVFNALVAQADNGVTGALDLTTDTGILYLDGDYEDSTSADDTNTVAWTAAKTLSSKTYLTLESTTNSITATHALTLLAEEGISILDDMTGGTGALVINADNDSSGTDGTLTVQTAMTITSNNQAVTITAWDVDLDGSLTAGSAAIATYSSVSSQTIGLG
jgi:hypothetical protein